VAAIPASIPSPSSGTLEIGPLSLNAYGLMIALGVVAGVWLFGRRLEEKGIGTREDAGAIAVWAVLAGVIGARLYHVITDWERFEDNYDDIVKIWEGGLGIPGGMLAGLLVGTYVAYRRGIPLGAGLNAVAPALPLAQAIGRWGNYFNQELFGRPTDLPWALEIDDENLPAGYPPGTTFHPTFLYESLWNFGLCGVLLWIDKRYNPAGGRLLAMYVLGYGIGRFWIEGLRIDPADELGGLRWNQWVAVACIVGGGAYLIATRNKPKDILPRPVEAELDEPTEAHEEADAEVTAEPLSPSRTDEGDPEAEPSSPDPQERSS
jgi:prolipoprotein diacylglyceryl transferase